MAKTYSASEIDPALILGQKVAVLGYGNQGHAHAQNLRDSGVEVIVAARHPARAEADGFRVLDFAEAAAWADLVVMALPDPAQPAIFQSAIAPNLRPGSAMLFLHGYAIRYGTIQPPANVDVLLVAPSGPGASLRSLYAAGMGLPALIAVHQDASGRALDRALSYAQAIGCARATLIASTFAEETETDLFGEQAVLCGGLMGLVRAGFQTLVDAGYQPEVAYLECAHQVRLLADLIQRGGVSGMLRAISGTAEWGAYQAESKVIGEESRRGMQELLAAVQDGTFAAGWTLENEQGLAKLRAEFEARAADPIEDVGREIRKTMKFLEPLNES